MPSGACGGDRTRLLAFLPACLVVTGVLLSSARAGAEDAYLASARLRSGYDANPLALPDARGSAFAGVDAAFAAGRGNGDRALGLIGEWQRTQYAARGIDPAEHGKLSLKAQTSFDGWTLRADTSVESNRTYDTRAFDASQSLKLRPQQGWLRPFVTGELRFRTLNETSVLIADFLPEPQRFWRATVIPGLVVEDGPLELGASVNLAATRYLEEPDLFGFRRNNERVQPFVFLNFRDRGLDVSAAVSRFMGRWHDADFSNVTETLYDVSLRKQAGDLTFAASASRDVADTTFAISPLTVATSWSASFGYTVTDDLTLTVFARGERTDYLDSPFSSRTRALGFGAAYDLGDDMTLSGEIATLHGTALNDRPVRGGVVSLSLAKRFAVERRKPGRVADAQWAASPPPTGLPSSPAWLKRPLPAAYQP